MAALFSLTPVSMTVSPLLQLNDRSTVGNDGEVMTSSLLNVVCTALLVPPQLHASDACLMHYECHS